MDKDLIKLYFSFIITLCLFIILFPNLFFNINNLVRHIKVKTSIALSNNDETTVNINSYKGNIIIMMDDGWKTQYTVGYNYMNKKNMRGSIAIITDSVNEREYLNIGDLHQLYSDGWDLLNHTCTHIDLAANTLQKQEDEIKNATKWLNQNGFTSGSNILIYPYGEYNNSTIIAMQKLNIISGRTTIDGFNSKYPINLYNIMVQNILSKTKPEEVYTWIDKAMYENLTLIILFHRLENVTSDSEMKYSKENFYQIIDYIDKYRDNLNIITYSEWIKTIIFMQVSSVQY